MKSTVSDGRKGKEESRADGPDFIEKHYRSSLRYLPLLLQKSKGSATSHRMIVKQFDQDRGRGQEKTLRRRRNARRM